jgi:hypothetical protein
VNPLATIDDPRLPARFWSKVVPEPNTGCYLWVGWASRGGYGQFRSGPKKTASAHRFAYEALVGPVPAGLDLDHLCRVRCCCNPLHLEPVTRQENCRRGIKGVLTTHCPQGHEYTPENTYRYKASGRNCVACSKAAQKLYRDSGRRNR